MGILDFFRGKPKVVTEAKAETKGLYSSGGTYRYNFAPTTAIEKLLEDASAESPIIDPYTNIGTSRAMAATIPAFVTATTGFTNLLGMPRIVSDNEEFKRLIEGEIWQNIRLHGEKVDKLTYTTGIKAVVDSMLSRALVDGMGFWQALDEDQNLITDAKQRITGVRINDSTRIMPNEYTVDRIYWEYTREGFIIPLVNGLTMGAVCIAGYEQTPYPWHKQLSYDSRFMAKLVLQMLVSRGRLHVRQGSPSTLTTISLSREKEMDDVQWTEAANAFKSKLEPIKEAYQKSINNLNSTGRPFDMIVNMPIPVDIKSSEFGSQSSPISNWSQDAELVYTWLCTSLKWPLSLLGVAGAGAFNQDRFQIERTQAETESRKQARAVGSELYRLTQAICTYNKIRMPLKWGIEWEHGTLENPKHVAETRKLEAEAMAVALENFAALDAVLDDREAADKYKDKILGRIE